MISKITIELVIEIHAPESKKSKNTKTIRLYLPNENTLRLLKTKEKRAVLRTQMTRPDVAGEERSRHHKCPWVHTICICTRRTTADTCVDESIYHCPRALSRKKIRNTYGEWRIKEGSKGEANEAWNLQKHLCTLKHQFIFKFLQDKSLCGG